MTDDELIQGFEQCTLPNTAFHHEQHLRVAFLYLRRYSVLEALQRFSESLVRFAAAHGKATLYHETITWAYILLLRERMAREGDSVTWVAFKERNGDLFNRNPDILSRYYTKDTLQSELAKRIFLMPDRILD